MSKVTLIFDSYEEQEALADALAGSKNASKIREIWEKCFRPSTKHGYDKKIQEIIDDPCMEYILRDGSIGNRATDLIEKLGKIYHEVVLDE